MGGLAEAIGTSEWRATWRAQPCHPKWCVAHIDGGGGSWLLGHFAQEGIYCLGKTLKRGTCKRTLNPDQVPTGL